LVTDNMGEKKNAIFLGVSKLITGLV
jgi:hypothetical protein